MALLRDARQISAREICATIRGMARVRVSQRIKTYLPASGWFAQYGDRRLPLVCWVVTDNDEVFGLVYWNGDLRPAEEISSWSPGGPSGGFKGYDAAA